MSHALLGRFTLRAISTEFGWDVIELSIKLTTRLAPWISEESAAATRERTEDFETYFRLTYSDEYSK